jgi:hypothetical protein
MLVLGPYIFVLVRVCYSDTSWYVELTGGIRAVYDI